LRETQPWRCEHGREEAEIRSRGGNRAVSPRRATTHFVDEPPYAAFCLSEPMQANPVRPFVSHFYFSVKLLRWKTFNLKPPMRSRGASLQNAGSSADGCDFSIIHRRHNPSENTRPRVNSADENCEITVAPARVPCYSILKGTAWRVPFSKVVGHKTFGNNYENDVPSINSSCHIDYY
jgi:hypothetical protein